MRSRKMSPYLSSEGHVGSRVQEHLPYGAFNSDFISIQHVIPSLFLR